jgi:tetratricopeptide (TPR) repeat protein
MNEWFEAEQHAEQAHKYYEAGQWEKALNALQRALSCNPAQAEWHYGLGLVLEELDRYEDAIVSFRDALALQGNDIDTLLHLSRCYLQLDRPRSAIKYLELVNQIDADCEAGYCYRILAYAQLGDHDMAEQMFYMARQIDEECPNCYDHIAQSLAQVGQYDKAIWCWEQCLEIDPHFPDAYANLATTYWNKGLHARAHSYFLRQLREDPGDLETLVNLGILLSEMGKHNEAREKFKHALELDPAQAQARLHLGEISLIAGHLDAAESELQVAQRLDDKLPCVRLAMARIETRRGNLQHARLLLREELNLNNHTDQQKVDIARLMVELRMAEPAMKLLTPILLDSVLVLDRKTLSIAYLTRGVARVLLDDRGHGISDLKLALTFDGHNTLAMHNLVLAYLEIGEIRKAKFWLIQAIKLKPNDGSLKQLRLRILITAVTHHYHKITQRIAQTFRRVMPRFFA